MPHRVESVLLGFWGIAATIMTTAWAVLANTDYELLGKIISSAGSTGVLGWLVWYMVTKAQPRSEKRLEALMRERSEDARMLADAMKELSGRVESNRCHAPRTNDHP